MGTHKWKEYFLPFEIMLNFFKFLFQIILYFSVGVYIILGYIGDTLTDSEQTLWMMSLPKGNLPIQSTKLRTVGMG